MNIFKFGDFSRIFSYLYDFYDFFSDFSSIFWIFQVFFHIFKTRKLILIKCGNMACDVATLTHDIMGWHYIAPNHLKCS